jgi:hypothetical protein
MTARAMNSLPNPSRGCFQNVSRPPSEPCRCGKVLLLSTSAWPALRLESFESIAQGVVGASPSYSLPWDTIQLPLITAELPPSNSQIELSSLLTQRTPIPDSSQQPSVGDLWACVEITTGPLVPPNPAPNTANNISGFSHMLRTFIARTLA